MNKFSNRTSSVLRLLPAAAMLLMAFPSLARDIDVSGVVTDTQGEPLVGATVQVKNSTVGTATDIDGKFHLKNVDDKATLKVSYLGYATRDVKVDGRAGIDVTLLDDEAVLDEVVVVGYGALSRKELSSSVVQVNKDNFQQGTVNNAMELMTGKVAGLNVATTAAANPNSSSDLQVRGATSLKAGNSPLIVIDGVAGGDIRTLSPQDIESMTVLKDAASAAIYGTRGANGVVLITTKKGADQAGRATVTYDGYYACNFAKGRPDTLTPDEFRRSRRSNDYGYSTDWYDLITRDDSYMTSHYIALDGSTEKGYYGASLNYKKGTGIDIKSGREEYGARLAASQRAVNNHLQFTATLNARHVKEDWGNTGMFDTALTLNPTMPVYNEDGTFYQPTSSTGIRNPVSELLLNTSQGNRTYILSTAEVKYNIWSNEHHNVNTTLNYSYDYNSLKEDYYTPSTSGESYWEGYDGRASIKYQKWWVNRLEWLGNYSYRDDRNDVKALVGYSYERSNWEQVFAQNNDFTFDNTLWHGLGSGSYLKEGLANMYAGASESTLIGFFGRVNYSWASQIFASASLRYEGCTKFGANKKWGYFPSVSAAWEMAEAPFLKNADQVQSLKLRASYGVTGRSDFSAYQSLTTYTTDGYYFFDGAWVNGYGPSSNANPLLGWEKSKAFNVGVDFMFFNRLRGSVEYFDRRSEDLLYNYTAPQPPYVHSTILVNVGTVRNTGVELSLTGDILTDTPVKWTSTINYAYGKTKLTKLSNDIYKASYLDLYQKPGVGTSEYFFRVREGGRVAEFYGYEYAGVDDNRNMLVYNADGEKILVSQANAADKRAIGNGAPEHFLTWDNTLHYRGFDLGVMFTGAFGFDIFNMRKYGMGLQGCGTDNVLRTAYTKDSYIRTGGGVISSYFLEKGDYFKLQNVTLGYTIPFRSRKVIDRLRVYVSAKNLFTLTKYSGNDPSTVTSTGITPGVDVNSAYPQATQLTFGVNFVFK